MFNETREGAVASLQISKMGSIDLSKGDFSIEGKGFQIKNDSTTTVELELKLLGMEASDEWVKTVIGVGWNPEIVKSVKSSSLSNLNLKWGY